VFATVKDPAIANALIPDYPQGCKRALISDNYHQAFNLPNVKLVASGVSHVVPEGAITADNKQYDLDALVLATGYHTGPIRDIAIQGLPAEEQDAGSNLFGLVTRARPNMFTMLGPQSWTPQGNTCEAIDIQSTWIVHVLDAMEHHSLESVRPSRLGQQYWQNLCDEFVEKTVWTQCSSWYLDENKRPIMFTGQWHDYVRELLDLNPMHLEFSDSAGRLVATDKILPAMPVKESQLPQRKRSRL